MVIGVPDNSEEDVVDDVVVICVHAAYFVDGSIFISVYESIVFEILSCFEGDIAGHANK